MRNWLPIVVIAIAVVTLGAMLATVVGPACFATGLAVSEATHASLQVMRCQVATQAFENVLVLFTVVLAVIALFESQSNNRRQLRAYVFVDGADIYDGATFDPPREEFVGIPGVSLRIKNSGSTPAHGIVHWCGIDVIGVDNERQITTPNIAGMPEAGGWIPAGGFMSKFVRHARQLTFEETQAIREGRMAIYVYGIIRYRDIYGRTRYTKYRLNHTGSYPPLQNVLLNFCADGNSAD